MSSKSLTTLVVGATFAPFTLPALAQNGGAASNMDTPTQASGGANCK